MALTNITALLIYCIIVTFTPGPTNIVILSGVYTCGVKKTINFVYGAIVAIGVLLILSVIFSRILIRTIPEFLLMIQIIGCGYLLYLAYQIYFAGQTASAGCAITFAKGFLMQLMNPKVILFSMTVIPTFVMPYTTSALDLTAAAAMILTTAFLAMITWAFFGKVFKDFLTKYQTAVNLIMAVFLIYSAIMIFRV